MTRLLTALWADESGFIITAELVLIATIVVLGLIAALICVRDSVGGELNDIAAAFRNIDQSYYYGGMRGCKSWTAGSAFFQNRRRGPATVARARLERARSRMLHGMPTTLQPSEHAMRVRGMLGHARGRRK